MAIRIRKDNSELPESDKKIILELNQYVPKTKHEANAKFECKIYKCFFEFGKSCASRWEAINIHGSNWGSNRLCKGCKSGEARHGLLNEIIKEQITEEPKTVLKNKMCIGKKKSDGSNCSRWAKRNSDYCPVHA